VDLPLVELLAQVRAAVALPLAAAGGLATPEAVDRGAGRRRRRGVMVGTVLLRAERERGLQPAPDRAGRPRAGRHAWVTRAFTGRPARALRNRFTERYSDLAPAGLPRAALT